MLYFLAKLISKLSFLAVYKKVYILNEDNVPEDRAALVTCNHPNGFVEPLVIAGYLPKYLYFLTRGDVFQKPVANFLLRGIHCIPIFRFRDGFASMRKNNESLNESVEILKNKNSLLVFAEGSTEQVRYVRPIQKGAVRLAFDTLEQAPESRPCIVPMVIHFSKPVFYRSEVIIEYGTPIELDEYQSLYQDQKGKAIKTLLDRVNQAMQDLSISVSKETSTEDAELVLEVARSNSIDENVFPIVNKVSSAAQCDAERTAGDNFSAMDEKTRHSVINKIKNLKGQLDKINISYRELLNSDKNTLLTLLFLLLGLIPAALGRLLNIIPILFAQNFANTKVKKIEFKAVWKLCSLLIMYPFYLLIVGIIVGVIFSYKLVFAVILFPILSWFSYVYEDKLQSFLRRMRANKVEEKTFTKLQEQYKSVIAALQ